MDRLFTALIFGGCAAPLFFVGTLKFIDSINNPTEPGQGITLSTSLFVAMSMVVLGFGLAGGLSWWLAGQGYLRLVQSVTGLMVAGWGLFGAVFYWNEPRKLDYAGQKGIIEIEVRVAKSLLGMQIPADMITPSFTGSNGDEFNTVRIADDGTSLILPWKTTVNVVYDWSIWLTVQHQYHLYFPMNLPYRPSQSTAWSDWALPAPHKSASTPAGFALRYRFKLMSTSDTATN